MAMFKRISLFLLVNLLVVVTVSVVLNLFHIQPYLRGYGLDLPSLLIFCLVWGMAGSLISLALSRKMAKWMMGVRLITPQTRESELLSLKETVYALARQANLTVMPEVGVFESPEPNAFATGPSKKRALVAVSTGLLKKMSQAELEGVIGHELSHITNGDMVTMTLLQGIINAFVMFLARVLAYLFSGFGRSRDGSSSGGSFISYTLFVVLFEVVFMILGNLVICAFSRFREFRADKGGARLAGKEKMIGALQALQKFKEISDPRLEKHAALQAFKISTQKKGGWLHLFATHPPLEDRIERLR